MENMNDFVEVTKKIPSKGLPYPSKYKIYIRKYKFGELMRIHELRNNTEAQVQLFMEGCKIEGFPPEELDYNDFIYLNLLRKIGVDESFDFKTICPKCGQIVEQVRQLTDIKIDDIDDEVEALPIILDIKNGDKEDQLCFSTLTMSKFLDLLKLNEMPDKNKNVALIAHLVINKTFDDAYDIIYNSTDPQFQQDIKYIGDLLNFGAKTVTMKCYNEVEGTVCNEEFKTDIKNPYLLVLPFRGEKSSVKNRIHFGKK